MLHMLLPCTVCIMLCHVVLHMLAPGAYIGLRRGGKGGGGVPKGAHGSPCPLFVDNILLVQPTGAEPEVCKFILVQYYEYSASLFNGGRSS